MRVPHTMDCPSCGRPDVKTIRHTWSNHTDPERMASCWLSGQPVTQAQLDEHRHCKRAQTVANLAYRMRDEDPIQVARYVRQLDRAELEALALTALTAINPDQTLGQMFGWVDDLGRAIA